MTPYSKCGTITGPKNYRAPNTRIHEISNDTLMSKIGETIPDITLEAYVEDTTKTINLADQRGKWLILLFYPADFTFVCPTELEEAAGLYEDFQKEGAEVMSVSTDTAFVHKAWHDQSEAIGKVRFPMLADPTGNLCRALGTYIEDEGISTRATFIIDPEGKIMSFDMHDNSIGRNAREILRRVRAAKFTREHKGRVCPASWEPGSDTLTPGMNLVGKI